MSDAFFYIFSTLTLASALLVVTNRNAVTSAMFLIATFLGMASLFVLLEAYFLAVIQVLVYAGAVVVLFLFIIMLLDVKGTTRRPRIFTLAASSVALALLLIGLAAGLRGSRLTSVPPEGPGTGSNLKAFGVELFTTYLLPMQVTGFLLLVAMIGVIMLSKRFETSVENMEAGAGK
jgi:NADH-quinone oxidoreductase subunit J